MNLDRIDTQLLNYLQQDAKQTNKQLSLKLNLSVTAVYERIKKLERNGIIQQYVALLDTEKLKVGFTVFCHIKLVKHAEAHISKFENAVLQLPEVLECFHVSGDYDYLLKVLVRDINHFRTFMVNKLTPIEHIGSTTSSFSIKEVKNTKAIAL
ncbi:MAG TPA: Lrp/AsnC family transcriptional regulator [Flavobacteriaceae bacterium]|jgi:Lrp/AsnC family leucine-responsive transcriptional regulator|nr:AsnC family transcriptional regulator [Flavobacteriaceae bacterium]HIB48538.1 Lrp/AsnC family transcriptional regulator [Flavobacteriaceae bacterium]HIN97872.1 Lrp/AsnC family transcriptional regulator [Flavobacteriaceae bacterium]|tara:strand:+ start:3359 stop:3817 length:459 start_codon:yes stop_codon:yes gene_type:complete